MAVGLGLLVLPALLPASHSTVNGARIWIRFGSFSFQPGEIAKLAARGVLRRLPGPQARRARPRRPQGARRDPARAPATSDRSSSRWGASLLILTRESDLGSSLLFFGIFVAMLYVATGRQSWLLIGVVLFVVRLARRLPLRRARPRAGPDLAASARPRYITDQSYQLAQGLFGQATGGIFGTGLGQGRPDLVPFANTDFIASTIARGARPGRHHGRAHDLPAHRDARHARRARHPRRLRQAARRRPVVRLRACRSSSRSAASPG